MKKIKRRCAAFILVSAVFFCPGVFGQIADARPSDRLPDRPLRSILPQDSSSLSPVPYSLFPGLPPITSSLSTPENLEKKLTRYYIGQYASPGGLAWLRAVMERAAPYLAFVRGEIEARGLPPELLYLPVIESQYLPTAVSVSGAAGLWQFMRNSIAPFDMKVNDWVDERRDFWKSTQGALKKLDENYRYFGDWPLALAAYNAGLGAVEKTMKSSGVKDYWVLSEKNLLKKETIQYVPKFLAAAHILSNPRPYGLEPLWNEDPGWTRVAVGRQADLRLLAKEAGVDLNELFRANRELVYNITPPGKGYYLKVKAVDAEKVSAVFAKNDLPLVNYYIHAIGSGDTLLALALHYGVTVDQILELNPGTQAHYLRIGAKLMIPAFKDVQPYEKPKIPVDGRVFTGSHVVKKGETLWSIARACDVAPEVLAEANGMNLTDILREGRTLKTPINN